MTLCTKSVLRVWQELTRQLQIQQDKSHTLAEERKALIKAYIEENKERFAKVRVCINYSRWEETLEMPSPYGAYYYGDGVLFGRCDTFTGGPAVSGPLHK